MKITFVDRTGQSILPNLLQVGPVEVYTYEECDAIYGGGLINEAGHICVGTPGEVGACFVSLFP